MDAEIETDGKLHQAAEKTHVSLSREVVGAWPWVLQRVSAVFLVIFLGTHLWVLRVTASSGPVTFAAAAERLRTPFFQSLDLTLLALGIIHSLSGIRAIVLDFGIGPGGRQALTWVLVVVGVLGFAFGVYGLWPLMAGRPLF